MFNNYFYYAVGSDQFAERLTKGYTGGNFSTDGTYVIGDLANQEAQDWIVPPPRPSYVSVAESPNWPRLSHEEALNIVNKLASAEGASDGYLFIGTFP